MAASFRVIAECDECDAEEEVRIPMHPILDDHLCAANYRTIDNPAGWALRKGRLLCCACVDAEDGER